MVGPFAGKVALVTGGGSGIGRATALAFAREGARVTVSDINEEGASETVRRIEAAGGEAAFFQADVSRAREVEALIGALVERFGRLDCAFNNAGIDGGRAPAAEFAEEVWDAVLAVNLTGVWLCMKHEIPRMLQQGGGRIVNSSSVAGLRAAPTLAPYAASKHGVLGLTRCAAMEYAQAGIRVNAVCPGWTDTPFLDELRNDPDVMARIAARPPMGRLGRPEEIAAAVVWLCSDASSYVTGHALTIDGALSVR